MPTVLLGSRALDGNLREGIGRNGGSHQHNRHRRDKGAGQDDAGVIAGFQTLNSREPAMRGVVSHGNSGRLGATSLNPISVDARLLLPVKATRAAGTRAADGGSGEDHGNPNAASLSIREHEVLLDLV
jgi:hypothetical protein